MGGEDFSITERRIKGGIVLLQVQGYLDAHTFEEMERELRRCFDAGQARIIIDLSKVEYISSAGAGVFISAHHDAAEGGGNIVLLSPTPNVTEVFDLLGLTQVFEFADDLRSAVNLFRG